MFKLLIVMFSNRILRWLLVAMAAFLVWQLWVFRGPKAAPYTETELRAVHKACQEIGNRIAAQEHGALRLGVAHFSGDNQNAVTAAVRAELARHDRWQVCEGSPVRKFLADISHAVANASSLDEIIHAGRAVEMDVIVGGQVLIVTETNNTAHALLKTWAVDTRDRRQLIAGEIAGMWRPNLLERATLAIQCWNWRGRLLLWLGFVILLPWLTPFGTRWAIARKSNAAGFGILTIYTLFDLLLAVALAGFIVAGGWAWIKFFVALLLCGAYNFWACEKIAAREK
ncbi:MAG: hypothetical protein ACOYOU_20900 [Kiritimatiellia bacterium]